jgi:hypothetical protein
MHEDERRDFSNFQRKYCKFYQVHRPLYKRYYALCKREVL